MTWRPGFTCAYCGAKYHSEYEDGIIECRDRLFGQLEDAREAIEAAYECHLDATRDHAGYALIPVEKYERLCVAMDAFWANLSKSRLGREP